MKIHIDCRCGCDVLCIEKIFERNEDYEAMYYFNMYRSSPSFPYFWCRLKRAWEYFRKGEFAYSDMTILDSDIDKMIEFLKQSKEQKEEDV